MEKVFFDISDIFTIIGAVATILGVFVAILIPIVKVYLNNAIIRLEKELTERIDEKIDAKFVEFEADIDTKLREFEINIKEGVAEVVTQILADAGVVSND